MATPAPFTACLAARDITETLDFYEAFGYTVTRDSAADDHAIHMIFNGEDLAFMVQPQEDVRTYMPQAHPDLGASGFFYLNAPDFDAAASRVKANTEVLKEVADGGFKMLYFRDPNGYIMGLSTPTT